MNEKERRAFDRQRIDVARDPVSPPPVDPTSAPPAPPEGEKMQSLFYAGLKVDVGEADVESHERAGWSRHAPDSSPGA